MKLHNIYEISLTADKSSKSRKFLECFTQWLEEWDARSDNTRKLTKKTYLALHHITNALLEITEYCLSELSANYVLLGKFQTESLEARFGQYRQLAGGQYDDSLRQIFECEKNLSSFCFKLKSLRKLSFLKYLRLISNLPLNVDFVLHDRKNYFMKIAKNT